LLALLQTPAPTQKVIVGLVTGEQLLVEYPEFSGFIQGIGADAVLLYRRKDFHGELPVNKISRIDFGLYKKGQPFALNVTLRNGQSLDVLPKHRIFHSVREKSVVGTVITNPPDPISTPTNPSTNRANR